MCDNVGNCNTTSVISNPIKLDKTVPTLVSKTIFSWWYATSQTSIFTYTDSIAPIISWTPVTCTIGEWSGMTCNITPAVCNEAGLCNTTSVTSNPANVDKTLPITAIISAPTTPQNGNFTLTFSDTDNLLLSWCYYSITNNWVQTLPITARTCSQSQQINLTTYCPVNGATACSIDWYSVDAAGNQSLHSTQTVTIDTTPPPAPACAFNTTNTATSIGISCNGTDGTMRYTTDGSTPTCQSPIWTTDKQFSATTPLKIIQCDAAGNISNVIAWTYFMGMSNPQIASTTPAWWVANIAYTQALIVWDSWNSLMLSGVAQVQVSWWIRDGKLLPPSIVAAWSQGAAKTDSVGIVPNATIYQTIQAWSTGTSLIASGWYFNIKVKMPQVEPWSEVIVYRSEDNGATWIPNTPRNMCVVDANQNCTIDTDHLSSFTFLGTTSTFYINNNSGYTNSTTVTLNANVPKANYIRRQDSWSSLRSGWYYITGFINNMSTTWNMSWVAAGTTATRWVNIEVKSWTAWPVSWNNDSIIVDKTPPTVDLPVVVNSGWNTCNGYISGYIRLVWSIVNDNFWWAGINTGTCGYALAGSHTFLSASYRLSGSNQICYLNNLVGGVDFTTGWVLNIKFQVYDNVGNFTSNSQDFTGDFVPPSWGSFSINTGASYTNSTSATLSTTCATDTWAGGVQVAFSGSSSPTNRQSCSSNISYTLPTGDWVKTVYMRWNDCLGNASSNISDTIILDTTAPTIVTLISPTSTATIHTWNVSLIRSTATDAGIGVSGYVYQVATDAWFSSIVYSGVTTSTVKDIPWLTNQTYYRRVRSFDTLLNSWSWSSVSNFTVTLYPSCLSGWNNDNFINPTFWSQSPTADNIICALYGSGVGDQTAYTKKWYAYDETTCLNAGMTVSYTSPLSWTPAANTVYVFPSGSYDLHSTTTLPTCTAFISSGWAIITPHGADNFSLDLSNDASILDDLDISGNSVNDYGVTMYNGSSMWSTVHNTRIHDAINGIYIAWTYNLIDSNTIRNNANDGIDIDTSDSLYNTIHNNSVYSNGRNGVSITSYAQNNTIESNTIHNNSLYGLYIYDNSDANFINDTQIYSNGDHGIDIENSAYTTINNIQSYDNYRDGMFIQTAPNMSINNTLMYNNAKNGIESTNTDYIILHNLDIFNNNNDGILMDGGNGIINNLRIYNNHGCGYDRWQGVYYYNNNYTINNANGNFCGNSLTQWHHGDYPTLWWGNGNMYDDGTYFTPSSMIMSWDYLVNPQDKHNNYLLPRDPIYTNLRWQWWSTYGFDSTDNPVTYSYGSWIQLQAEPVQQKPGPNIVTWMTYDAKHYIWSNIPSYTGELWLPSTVFTTWFSLHVNGNASQVSGYNLYGLDLTTWYLGTTINTSTGIVFVAGDGPKKVIAQIYAPGYFATHFEGNTTLHTNINCETWWDNNNFINSTFRAGSPTDENIICALYGTGPGDTTAYTQNWNGWNTTQCNGITIGVVHVWAWASFVPTANTIWVLTDPTIAPITSSINMASCSAIISSNPWGTTLYSSVYLTSSMIDVSSKPYTIFDNIAIDGSKNGVWWNHTPNNTNGIRFFSSNDATINNITSYSNHAYGIYFYGSYYGTVNNSSGYGNDNFWIYFSSDSMNGTISGSKAYLNGSDGIKFDNTSDSGTITNSKSYTNGGNGIYIANTNNAVINNSQSYNNNGHGIGNTYSNTTITNSQIYNNTGYGIWFFYVGNALLTGSKVYNNYHGVYFDTTNNTTIANSQIYNNSYEWVDLYRSNNNTVKDTQIYTNVNGLQIDTVADGNIFTNIQTYNNAGFGIELVNWSYYNAFNDIQSYNNGYGGIDIWNDASHNTFNTIQTYNNNNDGISFWGSDNNAFNTIQSYNNKWWGINIDYTTSYNKYYGTGKIFNNGSWSITWWWITWYASDTLVAWVWWSSWVLLQTWTMSRDIVTNPINTSGNYLLPWTWTWTGIIGNVSSYANSTTDRYSYGSGIIAQIQPVYYSWVSTLRTWWTFSATKYIWSIITRYTWSLLWLSSSIATTWVFTVTGTSSNGLISKYSLFGNLAAYKIGQNINTSTGIYVTTGNGLKRIITQIYSGVDFATHFETDTTYASVAPTISAWYISVGNTGINWAVLYYNWTITVRADVNITWWSVLDTGSCQYTINGTTRLSGDYIGNTTSGYCYKSSLSPAVDITIRFKVANSVWTLATWAIWTYIYDITPPSIAWTGIQFVRASIALTSKHHYQEMAVDSGLNAYMAWDFFIWVFWSYSLVNYGTYNMFVTKLSSTGVYLRATSWWGPGDDEIASIAVDSWWNSYVAGYFTDTGTFWATTLVASNGYSDAFIGKISSTGQRLRAIQAGGGSSDTANSIKIDSWWNSYVVGDFSYTGTFWATTLTSSLADTFVAKVSSTWQWLRAVKAGGNNTQEATAIAIDSWGNSYLEGSFTDTGTFWTTTLVSSGYSDAFVSKVSSTGQRLRAIKAGGTTSDAAIGIAVDNVWNAYVAWDFSTTGTFWTATLISSWSYDMFVSKVSSTWQWLRTSQWWWTGIDAAYDIAVDGSGNSSIVGTYHYPAYVWSIALDTSNQGVVATLSSTGKWLQAITSTAYGSSIALDYQGNSYIAGQFGWIAYFGGFSLNALGGTSTFVAKVALSWSWGLFTINNNATYTNTTAVTLNINCPIDTWVKWEMIAYGNSTWWGYWAWTWCEVTKPWVLAGPDGINTVYMKAKDALTNVTTDYSDTIILLTTPPMVGQAYISSGATGYNIYNYNYYYKWIIDISGAVSDTAWLNTGTCMYTTGSSRASALYGGTSTTGYCYMTWLNPQADITIRFSIQDNASNITTWATGAYIYDIVPPAVAWLGTGNGWIRSIQWWWTADDWVRGIATDSWGNNYIAGLFSWTATFWWLPSLTSSWDNDVFVAKVSSTWQRLRAVKWWWTGGDGAFGISIDSWWNSYVVWQIRWTATFWWLPSLTSTGAQDIFVAKVSSTWQWLWAKSWWWVASDAANDIAVDSWWNSYVAWFYQSTATFWWLPGLTSTGGEDVFVAKMSSTGQRLRAISWWWWSNDEANGITIDSSWNSYIAWYFQRTGTFWWLPSLTSSWVGDVFAAKVSSTWQRLRAVKWWWTNNDLGYAISIDSWWNSYVAWYFSWTATFWWLSSLTSSWGNDIFVAKVSSTWQYLRVKQWWWTNNDYAYAVSTDSWWNSYVVWYYSSLTGTFWSIQLTWSPTTIFISKISSTGQWLWAQNWWNNWDARWVSIDNWWNAYVAWRFTFTTTFWWLPSLTSSWGNDVYVAKLSQNIWTWSFFTINNNATYTNTTAVTLNITCPIDAWVGWEMIAYGNSTWWYGAWTWCELTKPWVLAGPDGINTVYMKAKDALTNVTTDYSDTIILLTTPPMVGQAYISSGATGYNIYNYNYYYKWIIDISGAVSDTAWLNTGTCMYTTGSSRASALYGGTSTTGYCYMTWLNPQADITIRFSIQDNAGNITTWATGAYIYDATAPSTWTMSINSDAIYTNTWIVTLTISFCPTDNVWWIWLSGIYVGNNPNPSLTWTFYAWCPTTITGRALSGWDGTRTVYASAVDKLWNTWSDFSDNIIVKSAVDCATRWNNDNFITGWFWAGSPTSDNIICALYGTWIGDTTAYTKLWSWWDTTQCSGSLMNVVYTGNLNLTTLESNTIYVLTGQTSTWVATKNMATCSAIISNQSTGTTFYSTTYSITGMFFASGIQYGIFDNIAINGTWWLPVPNHTGNYNGILLSKSSNNTMNNLQIYNNSRNGIQLRTQSKNNSINNIKAYNNSNVWIFILLSSNNNIINNIQTYNNGWGIAINSWSNNSINNSQSYNNIEGIYEWYASSNNSINNVQLYNNGWGIVFQYTWSSNNVINNSRTYNSSTDGIGSYGWASNNKYYGNIISFNNSWSNITWTITAWSSSDFSSLWRNTGTLITTGIMSRDYITNPINTSNNYLVPWTGTRTGIINQQTGYVNTATSKYSYGSGIVAQVQPVYYMWTTLSTGGIFDATKYIWSSITRYTWSMIGINTTSYTTWLFTVTWSANAIWISNYSIFGDVFAYNIGQTINQSTGIYLLSWDGTKRIVTQIYSWTDFATHFQTTTNLHTQINCASRWNNDNFITWGFWTGNGTPTDDNVICALYGTGPGDTTAYTQIWTWRNTTQCNGVQMNVVYTGNLNLTTLASNTIYVLTGQTSTWAATKNMATCSAIISNQSTGTTFYSTVYLTSAIESYSSKKYVILDNIRVNGTWWGQVPNHTWNYYWIDLVSTTNNTLNNIQTFNNSDWSIYLVSNISSSINNTQSYNNYDWIFSNDTNSIINNIQVYNNSLWWVYFAGALNLTLNNSQIYNNVGVWVYLVQSRNVIVNNSQIYNNGNDWIAINSGSNNIINNTQSYNNIEGIYLINGATGNKYYGNTKFFNNNTNLNWTNGTDSSLTWWLNSDYPSLWWSNGTLTTTWTMSRDYITNPINTIGNYLVPWTGTRTGIRGQTNYTGTLTDKYSYGSGIMAQAQQVYYTWTTFSTGWIFDATKYIWSSITRYTWSLSWITWNVSTTWIFLVTWSANTTWISNYSLFGDIFAYKIGQAIGQGTWIYITVGDGTKRIITQIYSWADFATHFETDTILDTTAPMIIFTWVNPWNNITGVTNNFTWQMQITETGIWLNQFVYTRNSTPYSVYDSWLLLMYNFDNVAALWENSSTVKDMSKYWNDGIVYNWSTPTSTWKRNWAYTFDWLNDHVSIANQIKYTWWQFSMSVWIKPNAWETDWWKVLSKPRNSCWVYNYWIDYSSTNIWVHIAWDQTRDQTICTNCISTWQRNHILITISPSNIVNGYINWILQYSWAHTVSTYSTLSCGDYNTPLSIWTLYPYGVRAGNSWFSFMWGIDEVRIYNRALTTWEIDLLYRSNLNKFNTGQWLFTDARMCMSNGTYNYTGYASDIFLNNYATGRIYNIAITGNSRWLNSWINLWSVIVSWGTQVLSWQFTGYFWVQDNGWTTWWYTTISLPVALSWITYSSNFISRSNIFFNGTWWISWLNSTPSNPLVYVYTAAYMSGGVPSYVTFSTPIHYIMRDTPSSPYSCPTGTYGNLPWMKVNIPAYQAPDNYSGLIIFDMNNP